MANRKILANFRWALAYVLAVGGDNWCRIERECGLDFDHRQSWLDARCLGRRHSKSCSLPPRDGVEPALVGVPCLGWWLDKFDRHARTASATQLFDKSGCNNELGAKGAGTSVRSLSRGTGNSKRANGESCLVDPTPVRGDTQ